MDLAIRLKARSGKFLELSQTLLALLVTIRKAQGCRDSYIYHDMEDGDIFFFSSQWDGSIFLEQYMQSESGGVFLGAIDLLGETVGVKISKENPWLGIEALKRMRSNR